MDSVQVKDKNFQIYIQEEKSSGASMKWPPKSLAIWQTRNHCFWLCSTARLCSPLI